MRSIATSLIVLAALALASLAPLAATGDECVERPCCSRTSCPEPVRTVEAVGCCGPAETPALPANATGELRPTAGGKPAPAATASAAALPVTIPAGIGSGDDRGPTAGRVDLFTLHAVLLI